MIKTKKASFRDLEKLVGRLNHAAMACPLMRYFLNRTQNALIIWEQKAHTKKVQRYMSSQEGMGGYDTFGNAWQFQLSEEDAIACQRQNNSLEFVAALLTVWGAILSKNVPEEACFLALCDNTSSVSWLHKPLHLAVRKYAEVLLHADCCLYSQHIAGVSNKVADLISQKFDLSHPKLTS